MKREIVYIASPFLPHLLFKDYQGFYKREEQVLQNRKPPTGIKIPLEALYRNVPAISFHLILQKVKIYVDRFTKLREGDQPAKKYSSVPWQSRGNLPLEIISVLKPRLKIFD